MARMQAIILLTFLIWLCFDLCLAIIQLLLIKRRTNALGKMICPLPDFTATTQQRKLSSALFVSFIIVIALTLLLVLLTKNPLFMMPAVLSTTVILKSVCLRKTSTRNGFYENGVVVGKFIRYDKIHSYKMLDTGEIMLIMKNGNTLHLKADERIAK